MGSKAGDIYYYGHASNGNAGYSQPREAHTDAGLVVTELYVRLRKNTPVLRLELLGNIKESQLIEILDRISYHSVSGYPYCLKCAHYGCKISDDDMERLTSLYSLQHEPRARGVLNE